MKKYGDGIAKVRRHFRRCVAWMVYIQGLGYGFLSWMDGSDGYVNGYRHSFGLALGWKSDESYTETRMVLNIFGRNLIYQSHQLNHIISYHVSPHFMVELVLVQYRKGQCSFIYFYTCTSFMVSCMRSVGSYVTCHLLTSIHPNALDCTIYRLNCLYTLSDDSSSQRLNLANTTTHSDQFSNTSLGILSFLAQLLYNTRIKSSF